MRFASLISDLPDTAQAAQTLIDQARQFTDSKVDVVFAFLSAHHRDSADEIAEKLWLGLDPQTLIGCTGEGVIGGGREIERSPAITLLVGEMPKVRLHPFHISAEEWKTLLKDKSAMEHRLGSGPQTRAVIAFGDPFTTPIAEMMSFMDQALPGKPLIGGMASAAQSPGGNALLRNDQVFDGGMVGLSLSGAVDVRTVVSQGCQPIGTAMVITKAKLNVIQELGGKAALEALNEMISELSEEQRQQIRSRGLLIGRAISEYKEQFSRGDFLVRHITGIDENTGSLSVGDYVRIGQTVQFQVHDAASAQEDLQFMLDRRTIGDPPPAALLFSCNGRGTRLFSEGDHDINIARQLMPETAIAGFFAAGEIGPVGGRNFIHGHTASFALLRPGESI
jgi:small ligand-binding sensory domain FIST